MWEKLKLRWNVQSGWDVLVILLVFACTGSSIMYVKRAFFDWTGLTEAAAWIRWTANIFLILPLYQVLLLAWGWLFGKFTFFWEFEKRMFSRIGSLFKKST